MPRHFCKESQLTIAARLYQPLAWIAVMQGAAYLFLEFVDGLYRVPSRPPEEGDHGRRWLSAIAFHRERKRRITVYRWFGLTHIDVGQYGGSAAVAMRLTRYFLSGDTKICRRRQLVYPCKAANLWGKCMDHIIEDLHVPEAFTIGYPAQLQQPAPAFLDLGSGRCIYL